MEYRRAGIKDLDQFLDTRTEFAASTRDIPDMKEFRESTKKQSSLCHRHCVHVLHDWSKAF
ncbi:hypothetical protein [Anaerostipes sp.]|uniref:hypothetical protein n=1 Tax=Anaerostipes sp. TaxID=1872530 RepID=UPI0025BBDA97|nr:hypothetical protein [Anaerostipes sp.]MBS7009583.1 hypothetical protein [Anaerostipes sp.]